MNFEVMMYEKFINMTSIPHNSNFYVISISQVCVQWYHR